MRSSTHRAARSDDRAPPRGAARREPAAAARGRPALHVLRNGSAPPVTRAEYAVSARMNRQAPAAREPRARWTGRFDVNSASASLRRWRPSNRSAMSPIGSDSTSDRADTSPPRQPRVSNQYSSRNTVSVYRGDKKRQQSGRLPIRRLVSPAFSTASRQDPHRKLRQTARLFSAAALVNPAQK